MSNYLHLLFLYFIVNTLHGQEYPRNYFRNPLDIPISLAGNFGEMRPDHFHAGLDLRTGTEGLKVHASADGYVSRIKVSPGGYGKVLYVTHPNGFVTVYGHLSRFNGNIAVSVRDSQYQKESYEIELFPAPGVLPVKKGEVIAFSGNTGNSGGPHVHFEIRDEKSEYPVNPLLFGMEVPDTVCPVIKQIALVPLDDTSLVNGKNMLLKIALHPDGKSLHGKIHYSGTVPQIHLYGRIGVEVETSDHTNTGNGINQVYTLTLLKNGKPVFGYAMNTFSFDETRYVNAHLDYAEKKLAGQNLQRCYLLKNNLCGIYNRNYGDGVIIMTTDSSVKLTVVTGDFNGNSAQTELLVSGSKSQKKAVSSALQSSSFAFVRKDSSWSVEIPARAAYDDFRFAHKASSVVAGGYYSVRHQFLSELIPLQEPATISFNTRNLTPAEQSKALLVRIDKNGKIIPESGIQTKDRMTGKVRNFGTYAVRPDTTPPVLALIEPRPAHAGGALALPAGANAQIHIRMSDNLSGIKKYRAEIDGKWILMEYEPKKELLFIRLAETNLEAGPHTLRVSAEDKVGNTNSIQVRLIK